MTAFLPQVTSPYGNNLHNNENVSQGQFAFTTTESGSYVACFWMNSKNLAGSSISLEWKTGISAKDWDSVAKKEKIEVINKFHSFSIFAFVISIWDLFIYIEVFNDIIVLENGLRVLNLS